MDCWSVWLVVTRVLHPGLESGVMRVLRLPFLAAAPYAASLAAL